MTIELNGEPFEVGAPLDLATLVREVTRQDDTRGVAVALNGEVIGRGEWRTHAVGAGDKVEILRATAGG